MTNWKTKFDKQFGYKFNIGVVPDDTTKEDLKSFIQSLLQEIGEEVTGKINPDEANRGKVIPEDYYYAQGSNSKRNQIIKTLKDYGVK